MERFTTKWRNQVRDYCDSQYELITVIPGSINFYYKCHLVATHFAIRNKHDKLALVTYREKAVLAPAIHFINFDGDDFIDNTVGSWAERYEYRFIRWVSKEEFFKVPTILEDTQKFLRNLASPMTRFFGDVD